MKRNDKKNNIAMIVVLTIVGAIIISIVALVLLTLLGNKFQINLELMLETFKGKYYWKLELVLVVLGLGYFGLKGINKMGKKTKDFTEGEDASLFTKKDIKKSVQFSLVKYVDLENQEDGVVVGAEKLRKNIDVILTREPQHTLVIGTTGSGKTTGFLDPTIQILAHTKTKPSLIISDPKGELYERHSKMFKEKGYKIYVLNLIKPYQSSKWNPFHIIITLLNKIAEIKEQIEEVSNAIDKDINNKELIEKENKLKIERQEIEDEIFDSMVDIIYSICPIDERSTDPSWQKGARDFILAVALGFIEDVQKGLMDATQITLFNLYYNISNYAKGNLSILKSYLENRDKYSHVTSKAGTVLNSIDSEKTLAGYLSDVMSYMQWLTDRGIQAMTSSNDFDFENFDENPRVLFIIFPDERVTRHNLVSMLITQCYKALVNKARENEINGEMEMAKLKRRVYLLLDEFGNLPKIENLGTIISVARSRQIFFNLIVQNLEQLTEKYGSNVSKIVKDNCPVKIFLGTDSIATMEEFIKLAGHMKGDSVSISSGNSGKGSTQTSVKEMNLINISDLKVLNNKDDFGNALVSAFGYPLFYSKFSPSWKVNEYELGCSLEGIEKNEELTDLNSLLFDISVFTEAKKESLDDFNDIRKTQEKYEKEMAYKKKKDKSPLDVLKKNIGKTKYEVFLKLSVKERIMYLEELKKETSNISLIIAIKNLLSEYLKEEKDER